MDKLFKIKKNIFKITSEEEFNTLAIEIFKHQYKNNTIYGSYVNFICKDVSKIQHYKNIPFLPIEFFRSHKIITENAEIQNVFGSSGTTNQAKSYHYVTDISLYKKAAIAAFETAYGSISDYTILALLPSYIERNDSSLVYMVNYFISKSKYQADCGFYQDSHPVLIEKLKQLKDNPSRKTLLLGVSFALLDFSEKINFPLRNIIVMETGGMKGKRKEIVREELHSILCKKFGVSSIHSEYGMTELLSQAYSHKNGIYKCPPWMKILTREINDPLTLTETGRSGGINIIDLANVNSCSFIATQDVGKCLTDGAFEITGRFDYSDTRGCNLMVE
ncbi:MAG: acyl transferase [Bacteroidetes bacterium]|nr:acyl transferase [Bacteroidota bacterium]